MIPKNITNHLTSINTNFLIFYFFRSLTFGVKYIQIHYCKGYKFDAQNSEVITLPTSSNQIKQKTTTNTSVSVNNLDHGFNQKEYEQILRFIMEN